MYNPYFANSQMKPYSGDTTFTQEKPKVVKVVQPVVKYVYVDKKEVGYKPEFKKPYNNVEFKDPIYKHEKAYKPKHRRKRGVLLPKKTKYSMKPMSTPRNPSYWPSYAGWYLSPHYYYSKSAYQNSQREKFWNRKLDLHVDKLVGPPKPKMYGSNSYGGSEGGYGGGYGSAEGGYGGEYGSAESGYGAPEGWYAGGVGSAEGGNGAAEGGYGGGYESAEGGYGGGYGSAEGGYGAAEGGYGGGYGSAEGGYGGGYESAEGGYG